MPGAVDVSKALRIVLVGRTGSGKSATGNTILGRNVFEEDSSPVSHTKQCETESGKVDGTLVQVIDTPGLFDTDMEEEKLKTRIEECVKMSVPGPHAFLLVIRLGVKFTEEERKTVQWIVDNFGDDASMYTIILFTFKDQADAEKAVKECKELRRLADSFGKRTHAFNNRDRDDRRQVSELIDMIKEMVQYNGDKFYTNEMYEKAQRKVREEEERRKQEEEEMKALLAQKRKKEEASEKEEKVIKIITYVALAVALVLVIAGVVIGVSADYKVALALVALGLLVGGIASICIWKKVGRNVTRNVSSPL